MACVQIYPDAKIYACGHAATSGRVRPIERRRSGQAKLRKALMQIAA